MEQKDRNVVLIAAAYSPMLAMRLSWSYLRLRRSAVRARKKFYAELRREGLPKNEAGYLADEYGQSVSLTSVLRMIAQNTPSMNRRPGKVQP